MLCKIIRGIDRTTMEKSGVLRKLPENWIWTTVGAITQPVENIYPGDTPDAKLVYLDISSISNITNTVVAPKNYRGSDMPSRARQLVHRNDILFSTVRTNLRNIAMVPIQYENCIASTGFSVLRPESGVSHKFLFYYTLSDEFLTSIESLQRGTSYPAVRDSDVREQFVPLAPINEQLRIVEEIEIQFSRLDSWLSVIKNLREQLPILRASILKAAINGKLIHEELDDESAISALYSILSERRAKWENEYLSDLEAKGKPAPKDEEWKNKYIEPLPPNTEELPELPEKWVWASVEQLGQVNLGRQRSPSNRSRNYPTKYIRAANITEQGLDVTDVLDMEFTPEEQKTYRLIQNDILISEASGSSNQVGKSVIWNNEIENCCFQNTVIRLRLDRRLDSRYFLIVLKQFYLSGVFARTSTGVGINHLSAGRFAQLPLPLPPIKEQSLIVNEVNSKLLAIDHLEEIIEISIRRSVWMRQAFLTKAFEGRLIQQDQDDENATKLLGKIQIERKRRAEEESQKPKQRRERIVSDNFKRGKSLFDTLKDAGKPLLAQDLFKMAGFSHETIDEFYEELRHLIYVDQIIRSKRSKNNDILLEIVA